MFQLLVCSNSFHPTISLLFLIYFIQQGHPEPNKWTLTVINIILPCLRAVKNFKVSMDVIETIEMDLKFHSTARKESSLERKLEKGEELQMHKCTWQIREQCGVWYLHFCFPRGSDDIHKSSYRMIMS